MQELRRRWQRILAIKRDITTVPNMPRHRLGNASQAIDKLAFPHFLVLTEGGIGHMKEPARLVKARDILLKHRRKIRRGYEFPGLKDAHDNSRSANIFFLGAIMDYQMNADIVWNNAEELADKLGSEDLWGKIARMPEDRWRRLRKDNGDYFHRFWDAQGNLSVAKKIQRVARNVSGRFGGDVRAIWVNRTTEGVYEVLKNDVQVNLGNSDAIVRMIVLALENYGHVKGSTSVKPDSNVKRVLGRVFYGEAISKDSDAIEIARTIYPRNPGRIDLPLYDIGKTFCRKTQPLCDSDTGCPLNGVCQYYIDT